MTREIKYQAYNEIDKIMIDWPTLKASPVFFMNIINGKVKHHRLRQCTGMKDMNDKDIYEGDLVRETHIVPEERFVTVCPIEFVDGMFIINDENFGEQTPLHENVYGCEVVGNIYETPELNVAFDE